MGEQIRTERLLMRRWRPEDLGPFADMNADPRVMEYFPAVLEQEDSDALAARADAHLADQGWGLWALEVAAGGDRGSFVGFTGLAVPSWEAAFTPCVEVGWRLPRWAWGRGYASEAARSALRVAFVDLHLEEVLSFTAMSNERSQAVMRRIGMTRDLEGDFDHPNLPLGHPLSRHALFRLSSADWLPAHAAVPLGRTPSHSVRSRRR